MLQIITLSGVKGVGKDTFAENLKNYCVDITKRKDIYVLHLADTLKELVSETFNLTLKDIEVLKRQNNVKLFNGLNTRELLIYLSQNIKKIFGEDIWVRKLIDKIKILPEDSIVLVPDLRYKIEIKILKKEFKNVYSIFLDSNDVKKEMTIDELELFEIKYDEIIRVEKQIEFNREVEKIGNKLLVYGKIINDK